MRQSRHLSQWLKGINPALNTYATDFEEEGYENLGLVLSMSGAEFAETLEEIGSVKSGHQKLLNKFFARLLDEEEVEVDNKDRFFRVRPSIMLVSKRRRRQKTQATSRHLNSREFTQRLRPTLKTSRKKGTITWVSCWPCLKPTSRRPLKLKLFQTMMRTSRLCHGRKRRS